MDTKILIGGNVFQYLFTLLQTNQVFQYIELGLAIATSVVLLAYRLWKWYKEAKADGKITKEEIKEGVDIIKEGVDEITQTIEEHKEKENKDNGDNN